MAVLDGQGDQSAGHVARRPDGLAALLLFGWATTVTAVLDGPAHHVNSDLPSYLVPDTG
ncbi:hypothetical protein [Streptomyces sp. NPDC053079]|uniref:hypothetical protein n=1 Tax=Streptomyces sp. NPDC053079 TaxID=3365697 RepID=UPI0037CD9FD0